MLLDKREAEIVAFVNQRGAARVKALANLCDVTEVTIRRDLKKLEELSLLKRTHGGAVRFGGILGEAALNIGSLTADASLPTDALILAPVQSRAAHTLRERAVRSRIPLIAESVPVGGAVYLGPDNYSAGQLLGAWTGNYVQANLGGNANVLDISSQLPNTLERSNGFADGLRGVLGERTHVVSVDGEGVYSTAFQAARNALRVHPEINVIFGINDDAVLAGLQAYNDLDLDPGRLVAVNVGGEGKTLFDVLHRGGPLKACMALFPQVVGRRAIEAILRLWAGEDIGQEIITPNALVTAANLTTYYTPVNQSWVPIWETIEQLAQTKWTSPVPPAKNKRVSFVVHHRTHEWYQNIARTIQEYATLVGVQVSIEDVNDDLAAEIIELRRLIGKKAATYVDDGDVIILDTGTATSSMAQFFDDKHNLTVITNSIAIFHYLQRNPNINIILIGGEFHRQSQSFVGRGAHLVLKELRADKLFLNTSGVSLQFGVSCKNQQEAEVRRAMIETAHEVVLLADHSALGLESRVKVTDLESIHTLITDTGALSADLLAFNQIGIKVVVADQIATQELPRKGGDSLQAD